MASIKNQISNAFKEINEIGNSKKEFRENGDTSNIHSIKYYNDALGTSIRFGEFCKDEYGVRNIFDIKTEHYQAYLTNIKEKDSSFGNMINIESHLQKFQNGIEKFSEKVNASFIPFIDKRIFSSKDRERPKDRSYTEQEINDISKNVSRKIRPALEMSVNLGLRVKEIRNIRAEHVIRRENGGMEIWIENGKGVTKGGRYRIISVPKRYEEKLSELVKGKAPNSKILNIKEGSLRSALNRACKKIGIKSQGWHGFRHTFARNRLSELLGSRKIAGQKIIRTMVENLKSGRRIDAKISKKEKGLYNFVKKQINQVHSELGHGQKRWSLVEVYMSIKEN